MERRQGYKLTEVGIIPEQWEVVALSSILSFPIQNGVFNEPSRKGRGCKLINVIDLYGKFPLDTQTLEQFDANSSELLRFGVKHGDIFFTRSSITADGIAQCNIYSGDTIEPVVFDCHIIRVRPNGAIADPFFVARYCTSHPARRFLVTNAKTTTMTTIDQSVIANLPVTIPPLPEQRAIVTALSDVDALLGGFDSLIVKKRDLKQAVMQQLLTGKTRLPGFQGEREVKTLGELATIKDGTHQTPKYVQSGIPFYSVEHVTSGDFANTKFISAEEHQFLTRSFKMEKGDILMTRIGSIGDCKLIDWDVDASFYVSLALLKIRAGYSASFIAQYSNTTAFKQEVELHSLPSAIPKKINLGPISNIRIELPPTIGEQDAIAAVLSDMDVELAALEARREKTRALKQGMMQELLTGRIRLVKTGGNEDA